MYIILVGGGNVGYYLTKDLAAAGHEVLLIEKDRARSSRLADELGELVLQGDGCEVRFMEEVGFGRADVVAAVTGEDEDNLIICQMAKMRFNVPRTIARVNSPANEALFTRLGIDATVSATRIIFGLIEQEIESDHVVPLAALSRGNLEIVEIDLSENSHFAGKSVAEIPLPGGAHVVALIRGEKGMLPAPNLILQGEDTIVALVAVNKEAELRRLIG